MVVDLRKYLDGKGASPPRVPLLLPILMRQARLGTPITYGDAAAELGLHHRTIHPTAGVIGYTLKLVGQARDWRRRQPPPLQALLVNDITRVPGGGVDGFMSAAYQAAKTTEKKRAVLKAVYADIKAYPHWDELFTMIGLNPTPAPADDLVEKAIAARGRGGEGPEHKALKEYVAANPSVIGLAATSAQGKCEFPLASGDRVDVIFEGKRLKTAVEVKSSVSSDGDIARGLFQCLKYRVVLEKQAELGRIPFGVRVLLVVGKAFPMELIPLRNSLQVDVIDNVVPEAA